MRAGRARLGRVLAAVLIGVGAAVVAVGPAEPGAALATGTVTATITETTGSYAVGLCPTGTSLVPGSFACSDGTTSSNNTFIGPGQTKVIGLPSGTYTAALATVSPLTLGVVGPVTVVAGQDLECTFSMAAAPTCAPAPAPGFVDVVIGETTQGWAIGFCRQPGAFIFGSQSCTDGSSSNIRFVSGGDRLTVALRPGRYITAIATLSGPPISPVATIDVVGGATLTCTYTYATGPVCPVDDGDGVNEPPGVDGNGDGIADADQPSVATFAPAVGTQPVTVAVAPGLTLTNVSALRPDQWPATLPLAASFPVGILGFTVAPVAPGATVAVTVVLPPGTNPTGYLKLQAGQVVDFGANAAIAGDVVTLTLTDGGVGDEDGLTDGRIVDPGLPVVGYRFGGFREPVTADRENRARAGQAVPVSWRITDAGGRPVDDVASFVSLTSRGGDCGAMASDEIEAYAAGASGLRSLGNGVWQLNWKTEKEWRGQCRTLTLRLADGTTRSVAFRFT